MMNETIKSYKSDNRGSAIITGLVVSTVLMVLCLSLLLVAYSFFISTYKSTSDLPNREMLYSAAEALEHELTEYTLEYEEGAEPALPADHALWNYVYTNIWQGFDAVAGKEGVYAQDESNGYWLYFNENDPSANHRDKEKCSRYFNLSSLGNVKIVVQLYWQLPNGTDVNAINTDNKNGTLLNAIYRMYDNKGNVMVKSKRAYKLSYGLDTTSSGSGSGGSGSGSGSSGGSSTIELGNDYETIYPLFGKENEIHLKFKKTGPSSAELYVINGTNSTIDSWRLYLYSDENVTVNDSRFMENLGNGIYLIQNPDLYNGKIEPGASATVYFINTPFNYLPEAKLVEEVMQALPANFYTWEFTFGGYQNSELNITNKSGKTLMGWELEFDYGGTINNVTNAIYDNSSHVGNHYIIKHADWIYKKVENGETIKLKLGTVYSYSQPPTNLVLKTFNLNAVEEFNQTEVNIMKYKWTRIGEEIINPGGDS